MPGHFILSFDEFELDETYNIEGVCDCQLEKLDEQNKESKNELQIKKQQYPFVCFNESSEESDDETECPEPLIICCEKQLDEWMNVFNDFEQQFNAGIILDLSQIDCDDDCGCDAEDGDECDRCNEGDNEHKDDCNYKDDCDLIQIKKSPINLDKIFQRKWQKITDPNKIMQKLNIKSDRKRMTQIYET